MIMDQCAIITHDKWCSALGDWLTVGIVRRFAIWVIDMIEYSDGVGIGLNNLPYCIGLNIWMVLDVLLFFYSIII